MKKSCFLLCFLWLAGSVCGFAGERREAAFAAEHMALDVAHPEETAAWWCRNLGFHVVLKLPVPPYAVFIADAGERFAVELYRAQNISEAPDYRKISPEQMHVALLSSDMDKDILRLTGAGAELVSRVQVAGNDLVMMRDPCGIPFQLVKRTKPLFRNRDAQRDGNL